MNLAFGFKKTFIKYSLTLITIMSQIFCTFCLTGKLLLDNIILAPPGRVCDVMLLSAPSSAQCRQY